MARWRTTVSIDAKAARGIAAHVATLQSDRCRAAHAACALVKLAYASPHHRSKIIKQGALKPLVEVLRDGAERRGGPGFSAAGPPVKWWASSLTTPGWPRSSSPRARPPLVALLSTEAAAAAATAIQTLSDGAKCRAGRQRRCCLSGRRRPREMRGGECLTALGAPKVRLAVPRRTSSRGSSAS